jgi:hypothetical protein
MHSRWNFLDRQPRVRIRIIGLFESPACRKFKRCAFEGHHIFTGYFSHDAKKSFSTAPQVEQLQKNVDDVLKL